MNSQYADNGTAAASTAWPIASIPIDDGRSGNGEHPLEPIRGDRGDTIMGPRNLPLERENPDLLRSPETDAGTIPNLKFSFSTARNRLAPGGWAREVTARELPIATTLAGVNMRLKPGGIRELHWHKEVEPGAMRELHWHPNADEWQYYIGGRARMSVFPAGKARTFDYQAGDVGYVPFAYGHYIENSGTETLRYLEMFRSSYFADLSLNQWMGLTTPTLIEDHLNLDQQTMARLAQTKPIIVASSSQWQPPRALPHWPEGTVAVLSTIDGAPHAIPVATNLRAGDRRILFCLNRRRASLARLRANPQVALSVLGEGNAAFTARGRASVVEEQLAGDPEFAAVAIEVDAIDDHRQAGFSVESGVGLQWKDERAREGMRSCLDALRDLVARQA